MQAFSDVGGSVNELKRATFLDETGDYGYKGKYKGKACFGLPTPEKVVKCANEKYNFEGPTDDDEDNRKSFAIMDIKEACDKGRLCFDTDEDGVPKRPNGICAQHDACPVSGA